MAHLMKRILPAILGRLNLLSLYALRTDSALSDDGWFKSFKGKTSVDLQGNPIPWLTYPAFEFLKKRVSEDMSVFEYGCGSGTIWWSTHVKDVVACEHDLEWYKRVSSESPVNVTIHHVDLVYGGEYSKVIARYK